VAGFKLNNNAEPQATPEFQAKAQKMLNGSNGHHYQKYPG
jgi:hypothetical protein